MISRNLGSDDVPPKYRREAHSPWIWFERWGYVQPLQTCEMLAVNLHSDRQRVQSDCKVFGTNHERWLVRRQTATLALLQIYIILEALLATLTPIWCIHVGV